MTSPATSVTATSITRRTVLAGACVTCAGALAACSSAGSSGSPPVAVAPSAAGSGAAASGATASVADVPVGGGLVITAQKVVITQPTAGTFAAFSATCTHQGCTVNAVANGTIDCPCHGSKYAITDGSVVSGPAPSPLPRKTVTMDGTALHVT